MVVLAATQERCHALSELKDWGVKFWQSNDTTPNKEEGEPYE